MSNIISASYNDAITVNFNNDAWFNATEVASQFNKRPTDWIKLDSTREYIKNLCEILRSEESSLLKIKRGGRGKKDSTWFHPKLAIPFARWLDSKFAIWCDLQIEKILYPIVELEPPTITTAQSGILFNRVANIAAGSGKIRTQLWSRFQNKFNLNSYKNLPSDKFDEALAYFDEKQIEYLGEGVEMLYVSNKELEAMLDEKIKALRLPAPNNVINLTLGVDSCAQRLLLTSSNGTATISQIPNDAYILNREQIVKNIGEVAPGYRLIEKETHDLVRLIQDHGKIDN